MILNLDMKNKSGYKKLDQVYFIKLRKQYAQMCHAVTVVRDASQTPSWREDSRCKVSKFYGM